MAASFSPMVVRHKYELRVHIDPADDGAKIVDVAYSVRRELLRTIGLGDLLKPGGDWLKRKGSVAGCALEGDRR